MQLTIQQFFKQYPDDTACLAHLFEVRYGQGHVCPKCTRAAKWYALDKVRAFSCQWCGHHIHPTVGTLFEDSRTSLQLWFYAIYLFTTSRHGVSAKELQRQLGVTYKCAWRMGHEIRKHMAEVDGDDQLSGTVEMDETMIGGKAKGKPGRAAQEHKAVIFGMMEKDGDVMTKVVPNVRRAHLAPHIIENVEEGSTIHTDELGSYKFLNGAGYDHQTVNHGLGEYVSKEGVTTNSIEGYWALLQRGIAGTHIHVSKKHIEKYAKEFEYRFNSRKNPDAMFPELLTTFPKS